MRRLILLRHATPVEEACEHDRDRELSPLGRRQAAEVAAGLAALGSPVDHVLCSTAVRTRQTLAALQLDAGVTFLEKLYFCGTNTLLQQVGDTPDEVRTLLVVGHSPPVPGLAARLASGSNPRLGEQLWTTYPPATWTDFAIDGTWDALARMPYALGRVLGVHHPSEA